MNHLSIKAKCLLSVIASVLMAPVYYALALVDETTLKLYDGAPSDVKELHAAFEKAMQKMTDGIKQAQDTANNALEEVRKEGTIHGKTNEALTKLGEENKKLADEFKTARDQLVELELKVAKKSETMESLLNEQKSIGEIITESDEYKAAQALGARANSMAPVVIGNIHKKTQIVNATGQNQPLVPSQRLGGIIFPAEQRLFLRDLIPQGTTSSNLIEFASETAFTNNARPQGDVSPVGNGEGEQKAESAFTFALSSEKVITLAHWIPASRQVLADAPMLQAHVSGRLMYGLKLKEEQDMLTGAGGPTFNGLVNQAASFAFGVTNQTALDTLLKAYLQVSLSNYETSGVVLHPTDWVNIQLLKDTTGRYLFTNPQDMTAPRLWAKPVVATQNMTLGRFLAGAFSLGAQIWDREDATVRISENVNDHFIRNMVAILVEERTALTVYRSTAFVTGLLSHAG